MKASSNETQTMADDIDEKSSWSKFCHKRGINPNLLMLKMTLFVMHGGKQKLKKIFVTHWYSFKTNFIQLK